MLSLRVSHFAHQRTPLPAELLKINSSQPEQKLVSYAAERIRQGQVLGMPTDTFYGLAADPVNLRAVERIYEIKSRSRHKPLSLLVESVDQAEELSRNVPEVFHELADRYWPGPLTTIVDLSGDPTQWQIIREGAVPAEEISQILWH